MWLRVSCRREDAKIVLVQEVLHDAKIAPVARERVKNGAWDVTGVRNRDEEAGP